jgi:hypothetical protein
MMVYDTREKMPILLTKAVKAKVGRSEKMPENSADVMNKILYSRCSRKIKLLINRKTMKWIQ